MRPHLIALSADCSQ